MALSVFGPNVHAVLYQPDRTSHRASREVQLYTLRDSEPRDYEVKNSLDDLSLSCMLYGKSEQAIRI
jgi:hypothetical protein